MDRSTLRTSTPSGTAITDGAKLRMLVMPQATIRSATSWAAVAGAAMTPIATPWVLDDLLEVVERAHGDPGDDLAVARLVGVEEGDDPEPAAAEPGVVGQRVTQVADADDDHGPVLGDPDLAGDLVAQVVDVVPDPAGAVAAEVGEVLAQLGGVDAGRQRELLAGAGAGAVVGQGVEGSQVDGQAGDRGLGDVPGALARSPCSHCSSLQPRPREGALRGAAARSL